MANFVTHSRKPGKIALDLPFEKRESISDPAAAFDWSDLKQTNDEELIERLESEIDALQYKAAMYTTRGYLELGHPASKLTARLIKYALADSAGVPIVLAHTIKTTVAAVDEFHALGEHPHRWMTLLATVRFLASPKRDRWAFYEALQAIDFVGSGNAKE